MSSYIVVAMREMALLHCEVGCRESNYPGGSVGDVCEFCLVGDSEHIAKAGEGVHEDGLDNALGSKRRSLVCVGRSRRGIQKTVLFRALGHSLGGDLWRPECPSALFSNISFGR